MCHLEKLERLVLSDNNLCDVPRLLAAFLRRLRLIDLSRNRFKRIPPVLAALTGLRSVDLSGNADLEACSVCPFITPLTPSEPAIARSCLRLASRQVDTVSEPISGTGIESPGAPDGLGTTLTSNLSLRRRPTPEDYPAAVDKHVKTRG